MEKLADAMRVYFLHSLPPHPCLLPQGEGETVSRFLNLIHRGFNPANGARQIHPAPARDGIWGIAAAMPYPGCLGG
jgi:hypothetical protein